MTSRFHCPAQNQRLSVEQWRTLQYRGQFDGHSGKRKTKDDKKMGPWDKPLGPGHVLLVNKDLGGMQGFSCELTEGWHS